MSHPDVAAQLLSASGEITSHFASPPYELFELHDPRVRTILTSVDVMGDATLTDVWTTQRFTQENLIVVQAVFDAIKDAVDRVSRDKNAAAELYLRVTRDKRHITRDHPAGIFARAVLRSVLQRAEP